jgi:hypothetical protein
MSKANLTYGLDFDAGLRRADLQIGHTFRIRNAFRPLKLAGLARLRKN